MQILMPGSHEHSWVQTGAMWVKLTLLKATKSMSREWAWDLLISRPTLKLLLKYYCHHWQQNLCLLVVLSCRGNIFPYWGNTCMWLITSDMCMETCIPVIPAMFTALWLLLLLRFTLAFTNASCMRLVDNLVTKYHVATILEFSFFTDERIQLNNLFSR